MCWWCCYKPENGAVRLPVRYHNNGEFDTMGIFCSLSCAQAYNIALKDMHVHERSTFMSVMYGCTGPIIPSPPRELSILFGGPLTREEYMRHIEDETEVRILSPPIRSVAFMVEEENKKHVSVNKPNKQDKVFIPLDKQDVQVLF